MASWHEFAAEAPALAALGRERFESTQVVLLGTLRKHGNPRITPVEFTFFDGELCLGGMWQSMKMLDLTRDSRCVVHSTVTTKNGDEGDFKLSGRALPAQDESFRARYGAAVLEATGWQPSEPFHLFTIDIREAAFVVFSDEAVRAAAAKLEGSAGINVAIHGADPNTSGYLVATWPTGKQPHG